MVWGQAVLVFGCLLGYALAAGRFLKIRPYAAPLCACALVICGLYFFARVGVLRAGAVFLLVVGLCLVVYHLRFVRLSWIRRCNSANLARHVAAGCLLLTPPLFLYFNTPDSFYFFRNDEYSHWALSTKVIVATDALFGADSGVAFKSYPPGTSLFHYFFARFLDDADRTILLSHGLLTLAAVLASLSIVIERRPLIGSMLYLTAIPLGYSFGYDLYSIYVDLALGAVFAAGLLACVGHKHTRERITAVVLTASLLILMKPIGVVLASILLAAYFVPRAVRSAALWRNVRRKPGRPGSRQLSRRLIQVWLRDAALGVLLPGAVFLSWNTYVDLIGDQLVREAPPLSRFVSAQCGRVYLMLQELGGRAFEPALMKGSFGGEEIGISLVVATVMLLLATAGTIAIAPAQQRRRAAWVLSSCVVGAVVYLGFLFYAYVAFFSMYEAIRLASFERYVGTYYFAWLLLICSVFTWVSLGRFGARSTAIAVAALLATASSAAPTQLRQDLEAAPSDIGNRDLRNKISRLADVVRRDAKIHESAYYIGQASKGYDFLMFRYLVAPHSRGQYWCWSLGEPYDAQDVWTCPNTLDQVIAGYEYVVIGNADARFWQDNQRFFREPGRFRSHGVYRVTNSAGELRLELVAQ